MDQTDSGCGFSIENPFCFTSAEEEFAFVDALRSPDGTRFVQGVKFTCENKRGDLVDHFTGYYLDANGEKVDFAFYANRYCSKVHVEMPTGWTIFDPGKYVKASSGGITTSERSEAFSKKLHDIKTEKEFDALYDTISTNSLRDFLAALADRYNHHDEHMIWMFGLFDLKRYEPKLAFHKFKSAASAGLPGAQLSLAKLFRHHEPLRFAEKIKNSIAASLGQYHKNNDSALYWVKQAITQGYRPAEEQLETWYLEGIVPGNGVDLAASIYLPKAQAGDASYMLRLSEVYRGRIMFAGTVQHHDKLTDRDRNAVMWRQRAAEAGNLDAQVLMGDGCYFGWNMDADQAQALHWYKTAADNGSRSGLFKLIDAIEDEGKMQGMNSWRIIDKDKDLEIIRKYLSYYKQAAKEGYERAARLLLIFIDQGYSFPFTGEEQNLWKSVAKFKK